eukprot:GHVP01025694.1.p1 GENE.GHVP01025694.1~~GHVP01025694.1.p1  ORF type:complete len:160 (-),score=31.55 GHVP01025694.1:72-551(-)
MSSLEEALETRKELEGPLPIRYIGAAAGGAMFVTAVISLVTGIKGIFLHPASFVLEIYEALFGLGIVILEIKDLPATEPVRDFFYKWFPFLTFVAGKGIFYIFTGSLGIGYWGEWLRFIPAVVVLALGVVYMMIYFGKMPEYREKMEETYAVSRTAMLA